MNLVKGITTLSLGLMVYGFSGSSVLAQTVTNTPTPTPTLTSTPTPTPQFMTASINCPQGQTAKIQGTTVICINLQQSQTQTANGGNATVNISAPASEVKQLPKTGLPLAAWALSGIAPVGFGLKKFGKGQSQEQTANYIWQVREFNKN